MARPNFVVAPGGDTKILRKPSPQKPHTAQQRATRRAFRPHLRAAEDFLSGRTRRPPPIEDLLGELLKGFRR
jgi:hypothetical protein